MKQIKGKVLNIDETVFGKYTTINNLLMKDKVLYCTSKPIITHGINAFIVPKGKGFKTNKPVIEVEQFPSFMNGDIISINKQGLVTVMWEAKTPHHALYVTDLCNSRCIMCPQTEGALSRYDECLKILKLISLKNVPSLGITGGEPTLNINKLVEILEYIANKSPNQKVHILTNGRNFKSMECVEKLVRVKNIKLSFGIPLYSAVSEKHDYIVGVAGAFNETIQGIYNLGKFNQHIEIRTVILRHNYKELSLLANYIYRNMPFVTNVALMGMEYHGNAETNYDIVSIDPLDYKDELYEAVREFVRYNIVVDVYNTPLCLIDNRIKEFCKDSISTWKKTYLSQCDNCNCKDICCGVFATSFRHSKHISPIVD